MGKGKNVSLLKSSENNQSEAIASKVRKDIYSADMAIILCRHLLKVRQKPIMKIYTTIGHLPNICYREAAMALSRVFDPGASASMRKLLKGHCLKPHRKNYSMIEREMAKHFDLIRTLRNKHLAHTDLSLPKSAPSLRELARICARAYLIYEKIESVSRPRINPIAEKNNFGFKRHSIILCEILSNWRPPKLRVRSD